MKNTLQNIAKVFAFTVACNRPPKTNESIGWGLNGWDVYVDTFNQFMDQHPKTKKFMLMMVWPTTIDVLPMARARARQDKSQPVLN
jgi:hypothetical protein